MSAQVGKLVTFFLNLEKTVRTVVDTQVNSFITHVKDAAEIKGEKVNTFSILDTERKVRHPPHFSGP
jgi:hypothetical protein